MEEDTNRDEHMGQNYPPPPPPKGGHSVGLSIAIGIAVITLFVGLAVGGYLGYAVLPQFVQQQVNQRTPPPYQNPGNPGNNGNNNPTNNPQDQSNNQINNNQPPSNPTIQYGGNGQMDISFTYGGSSFSGTMTANIGCPFQQTGNNVQFSLTIWPTSVSGSLQQAINVGGSGTVFNFVGTISNGQVTANAKGTQTKGPSFDFNLVGSIDQNSFRFTMSSAPDSQIMGSTSQDIVLYVVNTTPTPS